MACAWALPAFAQSPSADADRKQAKAVRVNSADIKLDGRLDEAVWSSAPALSDFTQKDPQEGAPASDPVEVRILYDDAGLYVGARMTGARVQAPMTRRDDGDQADYILIDLDPYLDRRTSHGFGVTASGVRLDRYHDSDDEGYDSNFDPVWEAKTHIDAGWWTAELRIPFSQLRFNATDRMTWGLNITRSIPSKNERDYWVLVRKTESGWASKFGDLSGLDTVSPPHRLEWMPYVASSSRLTGNGDSGNPFDDGSISTARGGLDMRMGIGSSLTLDATVNPDFGQIDADPAEVNLSAFETFFNERRPFFLEGSRLISRQNNFFYSRRVGARPTGPASGDFVDYPDTSTILGAAKLTGRTPGGTSIGVLGAVTGAEFARSVVGTLQTETSVAPRTEFAAGRYQQEFGGGGSYVGVEMAELHRDMGDGSPLADLFVRNAISGAADVYVRFGNGGYDAHATIGGSYIDGTAAAIDRRQRSSVRYFQRPDGPAGRYDPARTSLGGTRLDWNVNKISGKHWLWGANGNADSPELDTNDAGRLSDSGDIGLGTYVTYRETQPGAVFRSYSIDMNANRTGDYDGALGGRSFLSIGANVTWRNYWYSYVRTGTDLAGKDARLTRGGPSMTQPHRWDASFGLGNSDARQFRWSGSVFYSGSEIEGDTFQNYNFNVSARPIPALQVSFGPGYVREVQSRQYVDTIDGGSPATFGQRYVFGLIDRTTLSAQMRASLTFKPDLNLDVYMEPFAASGRYNGFGELMAAGGKDLLAYGTNGTTLTRQADGSFVVTDGDAQFTLDNGDFNVRSFRSNVVLRWEWRPGSTIYTIWQQNRFEDRPTGEHVGVSDLFGGLGAPGDNIFAIKMTVWLSR
ncbi:MAG TPA: DUF5916 domain-containing protein [Vicinamibacterales bacterium]|nr:DUF5916 domain-containing protein [Vicinamibacterales bacterium]